MSVLVNISAALIAKVLSATVDKRCPLSLTKPSTGPGGLDQLSLAHLERESLHFFLRQSGVVHRRTAAAEPPSGPAAACPNRRS